MPAAAEEAPSPPARFAAIEGHAWQLETLARLADHDALPHAMLFCGPDGVGKATVARALFARLLCASPEDGDACGRCGPCGKLARGVHPDVHCFAPDRDVFPIDKARQLRQALSQQPWESPYRLCLLEGVERMQAEAGNALLKTLEEPPPFARIVLVMSGSGDLLATIDSRCARLRFGPLASEAVARVLARHGLPPEDVDALAALCEGSPGAALEARDQLEGRRTLLGNLAREGRAKAGRLLADELLPSGDPQGAREGARRGLAWLTALVRDRLVAGHGLEAMLADAPPELLARLPADREQLLACLEALQGWHEAVAVNTNPALVLQDAASLVSGPARG